MSNLLNCSRAKNQGSGRDTFLCPRKPKFYLLLTSAAFAFLLSCGPSREETFLAKSEEMNRAVAGEYPGLQTDSIQGHAFNFMRSADMKLQVENVLSSTNLIESLVEKAGGYVSRSEMGSEILSQNSVRCRKDSILENKMYLTKNSLTLRVPAARFDTILRQITDLSLFLDYRNKTAEDAKAMIYANTVQRDRLKDFAHSVEKKAESPAKLKDFVQAREVALEKRLLAENKDLDAYRISERVNFSTLEIELYQPVQVISSMVIVMPEVQAYEAPYSEQILESLNSGLNILKKLLLFLTRIWGLLALAALGYFIFRKVQLLGRN